MRMITYPYGYGVGTKSMDDLRARYQPRMHPEFARRLFAFLEAQGGTMGIGGGFRFKQPDRPGFAPEGKSFHQEQRFADGWVGYCAVDLVVRRSGMSHRSPKWSEVPAQGSGLATAWGLHCNVGAPPNGESWHLQPVEIDGWGKWRRPKALGGLGRVAPVANYRLPVTDSPVAPCKYVSWIGVPKPRCATKAFVESRTGWIWKGEPVRYLQSVLRDQGHPIDVDGYFGPQTDGVVRLFQAAHGLVTDGLVGPNTWRTVDGVAC